MKSTMIKFAFTSFLLLFAVAVSAQKISDEKIKATDSDKMTGAKSSQSAAIPAPKLLPATTVVKPVVPGGVFKPQPTDNIKVPADHIAMTAEPQPARPKMPELQAVKAVPENAQKPVAAKPQQQQTQQQQQQ